MVPFTRRKCLFALTPFMCIPLFMAANCESVHAATGPVIKFLARPTQVSGEAGLSLTGHAFVIVQRNLNSGIKEQAYGFYPATGGKGQVKGPGLLKGAGRCAPSDPCAKPNFASDLQDIADVSVSAGVSITESQLKDVYKEIDKWAGRDYDLIDQNCVSFLKDVLLATGYDPPPITGTNILPKNYVGAINVAIADQNRKRAEADRDEAQSERDAAVKQRDNAIRQRDQAISDKNKAEADAKAQAQAQAQANAERNYIPNGWVQCNCPGYHSKSGKVVNGILWHPNTISCPS